MAEELSYVVIGNGITGVTAAEILRTEDAAAHITVIADDPFPVYYRPALKDYLAGRVREDKLWARPGSFYQDQRIRFLSDRVIGVQVGQHAVQLQSGQQVGYSRLLLANGAAASRLACPGTDLAGVTTLRTVADYQAVVARLNTTRRVVVTGSGTLALETIETLRHRGHSVTHLLRRRTLWSEVLDATASDLVLQQERRDGVDVRVEEEIAEITGKNGQVTGVVITSGERISCDIVIIAIGVEPIIDFIKSSGIPCGRGVQVDGSMRTSAPDVYAAGDVLETTDTMTGRIRVIGQWFPAISQGRAAAYSMLGLLDSASPFRSSTFYNATFLYGLDFASVGLTQIPGESGSGAYQEIIADPQPRTYRKALLKGGVAVGMLSLGDRKQTLAFKRAVDHSVNLAPVSSRLFAGDFNLNEWLDSQGVPPPILGVKKEPTRATPAGGTAIGATILKPSPGSRKVEEPPIIEAFLVPASSNGAPPANSAGETPLSQAKTITIGRQAGAYFLVDHASISRRHAEITYANGQYELQDLGSSNGTFVNEARLQPDKAHILKHNDRVRFGQVAFVFLARSAEKHESNAARDVDAINRIPTTFHEKASNAARDVDAIKRVPTTFHEKATGFYDPANTDPSSEPQGQPILHADGSLLLPGAASAIPASIVAKLQASPALIVVGRDKPQVFFLRQGKRLTLGRDKTNDLVLAEVSASRLHAEVIPGSDGFYIRDLASSNGVMVNQTRIDNPYRLTHGDRITIGKITIYFIQVAPPQPYRVRAGLAPALVVDAPAGEIGLAPALVDARALADPPAEVLGLPPTLADAPVGKIRRSVAMDTTQCSNCGTPNARVARFCANCGTPIEA